MEKIVYLEPWVKFNEKTGLLVPHDHKTRLDHHHKVNTHLMYLTREHLAAALYHLEGLVFKLVFIILWASTLNKHASLQQLREVGQVICYLLSYVCLGFFL